MAVDEDLSTLQTVKCVCVLCACVCQGGESSCGCKGLIGLREPNEARRLQEIDPHDWESES